MNFGLPVLAARVPHAPGEVGDAVVPPAVLTESRVVRGIGLIAPPRGRVALVVVVDGGGDAARLDGRHTHARGYSTAHLDGRRGRTGHGHSATGLGRARDQTGRENNAHRQRGESSEQPGSLRLTPQRGPCCYSSTKIRR